MTCVYIYIYMVLRISFGEKSAAQDFSWRQIPSCMQTFHDIWCLAFLLARNPLLRISRGKKSQDALKVCMHLGNSRYEKSPAADVTFACILGFLAMRNPKQRISCQEKSQAPDFLGVLATGNAKQQIYNRNTNQQNKNKTQNKQQNNTKRHTTNKQVK